MPTATEIRDAIVAKLQTVAGIGVVHGFERYAEQVPKFKELYVQAGKVNGWLVRRASWRRAPFSNERRMVITRWQIRGYSSLLDGDQSELAFDLVLDRIADAFDADETLGDLLYASDADNLAGIQLEDSGPVMFAGVLCHSARLALTTIHLVEIGTEYGSDGGTGELRQVNTGWDVDGDGTANYEDTLPKETP